MAKSYLLWQKKHYRSRFVSVSFILLSLVASALIGIGDGVIWIWIKLLQLLIFIGQTCRRIAQNTVLFCVVVWRKTKQLVRKITSPFRRKRKGVVFNYRNYEQKVTKQRRKKSVYISLLTKVKYLFAGIIFSCFFVFLPLVAVIFIQDLPSPNELSLRQIPQTTKIYDRNGTLLYQIYAQQNRTIVPLQDVPVNLQHATIAIEDKNFYTHPGFDFSAIVRAGIADMTGKPIQGGSTITQQLIKSSLLTSEQNLLRKVKEVILALWAERIYSKNQILEMYFNQVPYGGTAWGVEAASELYFNEHVQDLDLAQSAFLAGLTSSPTTYSPFGNTPNLWKKRQQEVLSHMVELEYITPQQAKDAANEQLSFAPQQTPYYAPHFVNYVVDLLEKKYGAAMVERGGLTVTTSLDLHIQDMSQQVVRNEVAQDGYLNLTNGAAVVTNPQNGDILAMVGGHDFNDPNGGNVNVATSLRQPGSSIKVVTYSAALSHGFTAASIIDDSPVTFSNPWETYSPVNYDGRFHGRVTLRTALANSFNIPAVKTLNQIGIPTMVDLGKQMGIQSWGDASQYGLSITLGGADVTMLDMANVYGTLANNGTHVEVNPILKITDYKGNVIEQKDDSTMQKNNVLDPGVAFILGNILADNNARQIEFGSNSPLNIPGHYVSVKTGTTDNKDDNWTDGYTKNYVVVVWVGNNDHSPMSQTLASGITGAAPIWHGIMSNLVQNESDPTPSLPDDVIQKNCNGHDEYFIKGTENMCPSFPTGSPSPTNKP